MGTRLAPEGRRAAGDAHRAMRLVGFKSFVETTELAIELA
jgi:hypothetical protein